MDESSDSLGALPTVRASGRGFEARRVLGSLKRRLLGAQSRTTIDRYEITGRIGQGAMGTVYRARDPKLERDVAIKLVRPASAGTTDPTRAAARLLAEARAMASVTHPNVVAVYDAGQVDREIFVVMELVGGPSFAELFADRPLPWREATALAIGAARGLAAAHAHGIVHRDVKPTNIVVAPGGVAKVVDFGLADAGGDERTTGRALAETFGSSTPNDTRTGSVVGTPAFMAPEQFRGLADERSDQYALCLSLLQAITGRLPFTGSSFGELCSAKIRGALQRPEGLPDTLWAAIERGASPDAARRFATVDELREQLERALIRRRPPFSVALGAVVVGALAVWLSGGGAGECTAAGAEIDATWNAERRAALLAKIESSSNKAAPEIAAWVGHRVDAQADAWSRERIRECGAGSTDVSPCLNRVRAELHELVTVAEELGEAKAGLVPSFFGGLTLPQSCASEDASGRAPGVWAGLEAQTERVRALVTSERFEEARRVGERLEARAVEAGSVGIADRVAFLVALARVGEGDFETAITEMEGVYASAMARGDFAHAAEAATEILHQHQSHGAPAETQREWAKHSESAAARVGDLPAVQAALESSLAKLDWNEGRLTSARDRLERAIAAYSRTSPHGSVTLARTLGGLGLVQADLGEVDLARDTLLESVEMMRVVSPGSRDLALALQNLSRVTSQAEEPRAALEFAREADALAAELTGSTHPLRLVILGNLATALKRSERCEEALALMDDALMDGLPEHLQDHPFVSALEQIEASCLIELNRPADAVDVAERALEKLAGSNEYVRVGYTQYFLADALWRSGRDPRRAVSLMQEVHERLDGVEGGQKWRLFAEDWLAARPPGDPPLR